MILPSKHIRFSESLLGLGGVILEILQTPMTIDEIWNQYQIINKDRKKLPAYHNFENIILAVNFLFLINAIQLNTENKLEKCN